MAMREITVHGVRWTVWDVRPGLASGEGGQPVRAELADGWLCFESRDEKRRILPSPADWCDWDDDRLAAALATADVVRKAGNRE
ncbi:MAG TPA: hypothetical protein VE913_20495 [Longimicrobium sp.]|nr:hypothetical protein [Longimicrobium sp.]